VGRKNGTKAAVFMDPSSFELKPLLNDREAPLSSLFFKIKISVRLIIEFLIKTVPLVAFSSLGRELFVSQG